jgi:hypothetical protein
MKDRFEDLCLLVEQDEGAGIYPMGHLSKEQRNSIEEERSDAYKCGWNNAHVKGRASVDKILEQAESGLDEDVRLMLASGCAFWSEGKLELNMNDTWSWALGWCPEVPQDQVKEVARLFRLYGSAGLYYWHSCQENNMKSEFADINRFVEFVRNEEKICQEVPLAAIRAYHKVKYEIGG